MPYTKKNTYPKRTYGKKTNYKRKYVRNYKPRNKPVSVKSPKKDLYTKESVRAQDLSGFDKSIYKVNKIIGEVGHGVDVLAKPVKGAITLAKKLFGF